MAGNSIPGELYALKNRARFVSELFFAELCALHGNFTAKIDPAGWSDNKNFGRIGLFGCPSGRPGRQPYRKDLNCNGWKCLA